jgi:uncharacterized Fe-S cluster-containing radical SAM superfamily protein
MNSQTASPPPRRLDTAKFRDPLLTLQGAARASVGFTGLRMLWINTGTLCNITCANCYIESSPGNDALAYISAGEVAGLLDEAAALGPTLEQVGFTGGEPFLNRELPAMLREVLGRGLQALVLTNAMKPMLRHAEALLALAGEFGDRLILRVSLDHFDPARHDAGRGGGNFAQVMAGLGWLVRHGVAVRVAGRAGLDAAGEAALRRGFALLFAAHGIPLDAGDRQALVLFPEMDAGADVPEITTACWDILHKRPDELMCATARMAVKRKGADRPAVVACTLLPYDPRFELGATLAEAARPVALNHPHCARFCVLGGGSCAPPGG